MARKRHTPEEIAAKPRQARLFRQRGRDVVAGSAWRLWVASPGAIAGRFPEFVTRSRICQAGRLHARCCGMGMRAKEPAAMIGIFGVLPMDPN